MGEAKVQPFLKWAGGKRWLTQSGQLELPTKFGTYFEPFLGSGAVYFSLNPARAVLSDLNGRLVEAYQCVKRRPSEVRALLVRHHALHSKAYYYQIRGRKYEDALERAGQFLYLNRACWNGLYRVNQRGEFNVPIGTKDKIFDPTEDFEALSSALGPAQLNHCDFEVTVGQAGHGDLIFCDPPYTTSHNSNGFIKYNERIFSWNDQERLAAALFDAKARGATIVLTNADHPSLRELYRGADCLQSVPRSSVISAKREGRSTTTELLIRL